MDVGLDAVSPRMIAIMMKARRPERYIQSFLQTDAWMNRYRVPHSVYSILNYPGETSETLKETLQFWTRYYEEHEAVTPSSRPRAFKFFPGCEVFTNWKHYEQTYGARVLHPEWWKLCRPVHSELAGQIVPSRELVETGKLGYDKVVNRVVTSLASATVSDAAHELMMSKLAPWAELRVANSYLDDKRLELGMDSCVHKKEDTRIVLFNFDSGATHTCSTEESSWIEHLLEEGLTVGALRCQQADLYAECHEARDRVQEFLHRMITSGFVQVQVPSPPAGILTTGTVYQAVIQTKLGTMAFELLPEEAPVPSRSSYIWPAWVITTEFW